MDIINQTVNQINDLFKSMTPSARLLAGLLIVAIVVSLGFLFTQPFSGGDDYLLGGVAFSAHELPAMEAAFGKANLAAYTVEGNRIKIPKGLQARYMAALADNGALPSHFGDHLAKATSSTSPFVSSKDREEILKVAKQQELAMIIRSMTGIDSASVLYDTQKRGGLRPSSTTTASVSVKSTGGRPIENNQVGMIRHLVAGAIAGLSPKDVTVADLNTGRVHADSSGPDSPGTAMDDPYISRKREYESLMAEKVLASLSYVPGVAVSVNADLSKELRRREENDQIDPKQTVAITTREETTNSNQTGQAPAGRPGVAAQAPNQAAALNIQTGPESTEERSMSEVNNLVSKKRTMTDFAALTPERVTVSIGIPSKYLVDVWRQQNPAPAGQPPKDPDQVALVAIEKAETDRIRRHVEPLIPKPLQADPAVPLVTVTSFSSMPNAAAASIGISDQAMYWLGNHWSTVALIGLALLSLQMLRGFVSQATAQAAAAPEATPGQIVSATIGANGEDEVDDDKPQGRLKRRQAAGLSLRDELVDMVKEDPDAAANILRSWIGNPT
jgi:flagellar M-ring protein FliF